MTADLERSFARTAAEAEERGRRAGIREAEKVLIDRANSAAIRGDTEVSDALRAAARRVTDLAGDPLPFKEET